MKLIIRYFSCEDRFSRLYAYHIRLSMHFMRVRLMSIPYFMCRNIERMTFLVQKKTPAQQHNSIYHYALIKIMVVHQLAQQGITWDEFISRDFFAAPQPPEIVHDEAEPSHQFQFPETEHISAPMCVTYQRGHRALFAASRRVLSPPGVEGVSLTSSVARVLSPHGVEGVSPSTSAQVQVQDRGKMPMHDEGPSGGQDTDFILIDVNSSSPSSKLKEIIQEKKAKIDTLTVGYILLGAT